MGDRAASEITQGTTRAAGFTTASADATVVADTGAIATAGDYIIEAHLGSNGIVAAGKGISLVRRNAANSGDVEILAHCPANNGLRVQFLRWPLALNERVVARTRGTHAASEDAHASIAVTLKP